GANGIRRCWRNKGPIAVTDQNANVRTVRIRDRKVQLAVSIEVPYCNEYRICPDRIGWRRGNKGAVPVSNKHAYIVPISVRHNQISFSVTIEVSSVYRDRIRPHRKVACGGKAHPVALGRNAWRSFEVR